MSKLPHPSILVAEDDADSRLMLRLFLEHRKYNIIEAKNGEEAVRLAEKEKPDLILMDLNMPVMDGVTAATIIRNFTELGDVPIIAMSAYGEQGIGLFLNIEQLGEGFIEYITKPINLDSLAEQIETLITGVGKV